MNDGRGAEELEIASGGARDVDARDGKVGSDVEPEIFSGRPLDTT